MWHKCDEPGDKQSSREENQKSLHNFFVPFYRLKQIGIFFTFCSINAADTFFCCGSLHSLLAPAALAFEMEVYEKKCAARIFFHTPPSLTYATEPRERSTMFAL